MLLAIDTGNTNTVFAVFKGDKLLESWRLQTENARRSEEHTSELQSRSDLVCRLLLEKKKTEMTTTSNTLTKDTPKPGTTRD